MAIGYDTMIAEDAMRYFNGCWAYHIGEDDQVEPYWLSTEVYEDYFHELAHDMTYTVQTWVSGDERAVTGEELFGDPSWITHRFQLGYVPTSDTTLVRIDAEPVSSRMQKGMTLDHCASLPIVVTNTGRLNRRLATRIQGHLSARPLAEGIARVLSLGTPPVILNLRRRNRSQVYREVREQVALFMENEAVTVFVPDFRMALVKHRTYKNRAYILYNGVHIGMLKGTEATLLRSRSGSRKVSSYIDDSRHNMTLLLITPTVRWVNK